MLRSTCDRRRLARLVTMAIAGAISGGCGGGPAMTAADGGGSGARDATTTPDGSGCATPGSAVGIAPEPGDAATDASILYTVTYGVDPTCCAPQLLTTQTFGNGTWPDPRATCGYSVEVPCGIGPGFDAGPVPCSAQGMNCLCTNWCAAAAPPGADPSIANGCEITLTDAGGAIATCTGLGSGCGFGRPPRGFFPRPVAGGSPLGRTLARMAQIEAASVEAFEALHGDLASLGAPRALLRAVRAAAEDEVRHARAVGREAERQGTAVPRVHVPSIAPRSIEQLAVDNAEDGCVRETFGAALMTLQARRARTPRLRAMLRVIAREELGHAALSWRVARWLDARLDADARERVRRARGEALRGLAAELAPPLEPDDDLGAPDGAVQRRLLAALEPALRTGALAIAA